MGCLGMRPALAPSCCGIDMAGPKNFSQGGRHEPMTRALQDVFNMGTGKTPMKDIHGGDTPAKPGKDAARMLRKK